MPMPDQFDRDKAELGWRAAMGLWLENRTSAPRIIGWTDPWLENRTSAPRIIGWTDPLRR